MKETDILGIRLKNYSLREELRTVNEYLKDGALNTILYISNAILMKAGEVPEQKEWIESMDMTIFGDADILHASGVESRNRLREVENDEFFKEFLKRVVREHKTVFLIAQTQEDLDRLRESILAERENIRIVGGCLPEADDMAQDPVVNEINDMAPNAVISCLPFELQAKYMYEYRRMVNADIWLGLLLRQNTEGIKPNVWSRLYKKYVDRLFRKRVIRYKEEKTKEGGDM